MSAGDSFLQGMDVSKWQATTPSLTGVNFLIARCTYGTKVDPMYAAHIAAGRAAKVPILGAYHFAYDNISISDQVNAFLAAAGDVLILALDVEGTYALNKAQATQFISLLRSRDPRRRKIALYMSESPWLGDCGQDIDWVANYSREPRIHYDIWQYGPFHGADGNFFAGTLSDLRALAGAPIPMNTFTVNPKELKVGTLTVADPDHWYLRLKDGSKTRIVPGAAWTNRPAFGPVTLSPDIDGNATTGDRAVVYIVGNEAAAVLAKDCVFTEAPDPLAAQLRAEQETNVTLNDKVAELTGQVSTAFQDGSRARAAAIKAYEDAAQAEKLNKTGVTPQL